MSKLQKNSFIFSGFISFFIILYLTVPFYLLGRFVLKDVNIFSANFYFCICLIVFFLLIINAIFKTVLFNSVKKKYANLEYYAPKNLESEKAISEQYLRNNSDTLLIYRLSLIISVFSIALCIFCLMLSSFSLPLFGKVEIKNVILFIFFLGIDGYYLFSFFSKFYIYRFYKEQNKSENVKLPKFPETKKYIKKICPDINISKIKKIYFNDSAKFILAKEEGKLNLDISPILIELLSDEELKALISSNYFLEENKEMLKQEKIIHIRNVLAILIPNTFFNYIFNPFYDLATFKTLITQDYVITYFHYIFTSYIEDNNISKPYSSSVFKAFVLQILADNSLFEMNYTFYKEGFNFTKKSWDAYINSLLGHYNQYNDLFFNFIKSMQIIPNEDFQDISDIINKLSNFDINKVISRHTPIDEDLVAYNKFKLKYFIRNKKPFFNEFPNYISLKEKYLANPNIFLKDEMEDLIKKADNFDDQAFVNKLSQELIEKYGESQIANFFLGKTYLTYYFSKEGTPYLNKIISNNGFYYKTQAIDLLKNFYSLTADIEGINHIKNIQKEFEEKEKNIRYPENLDSKDIFFPYKNEEVIKEIIKIVEDAPFIFEVYIGGKKQKENDIIYHVFLVIKKRDISSENMLKFNEVKQKICDYLDTLKEDFYLSNCYDFLKTKLPNYFTDELKIYERKENEN